MKAQERAATRSGTDRGPEGLYDAITELTLAFTFSTDVPERPHFAGTIIDEYTPRPVLIWRAGGAPLRFEGNLNAV